MTRPPERIGCIGRGGVRHTQSVCAHLKHCFAQVVPYLFFSRFVLAVVSPANVVPRGCVRAMCRSCTSAREAPATRAASAGAGCLRRSYSLLRDEPWLVGHQCSVMTLSLKCPCSCPHVPPAFAHARCPHLLDVRAVSWPAPPQVRPRRSGRKRKRGALQRGFQRSGSWGRPGLAARPEPGSSRDSARNESAPQTSGFDGEMCSRRLLFQTSWLRRFRPDSGSRFGPKMTRSR